MCRRPVGRMPERTRLLAVVIFVDRSTARYRGADRTNKDSRQVSKKGKGERARIFDGCSELVLRSFRPTVNAFVFEGDQASREGFVFNKAEVAFRIAGWEEREALTDKFRNDAQVEFVDQIVLEESARQFAAAHVPNILAFFLAEGGDEFRRGRVDDGDAGAFAGFESTREDVTSEAVVGEFAAAHAQP